MDESSHRIDLLDGSLIVSPAPSKRHQLVSWNLVDSLRPADRPRLAALTDTVQAVKGVEARR